MRSNFIYSEVKAGLRRNISMTVAMIITTAISLALFGGGLLVVQLTNQSKKIFLSRVEVQLFEDSAWEKADPDCLQKQCTDLVNQLRQMPGVTSVIFITKKEAVQDAITRTFASQPEMQKLAANADLPSSFRVQVNSPNDIDAIVKDFSPPHPGISYVEDQRQIVDRIFAVLDGVRDAAFMVAIVQAVAAVLLIANTVQMAAFSRKTEVSIMGLVGASRWYMQLPFLLEAVLASFIGSVLAVVGLFVSKKMVIDQALGKLYGNSVLNPITNYQIFEVAPILIIAGAVLASITAYITLRLYVRN